MSQMYAFTIKNIRVGEYPGPLQLQDYEDHMLNTFKGTLMYSHIEHDSLNRNHLHGAFKARKNIRFSLCKIPYVHFDIQPLKTHCDEEVWRQYCLKENWDVVQQKFISSLYEKEYGFDQQVDI